MTRDQGDEYYLTVAEVAETLRLNPQTVRNWIDQGSLPALRVGRRVRIKRSDLDRLLSEGYSAGPRAGVSDDGPSAEDFWGGEPVGVAEPAAGEAADRAAGGAEAAAARAQATPGDAQAADQGGAEAAAAVIGDAIVEIEHSSTNGADRDPAEAKRPRTRRRQIDQRDSGWSDEANTA